MIGDLSTQACGDARFLGGRPGEPPRPARPSPAAPAAPRGRPAAAAGALAARSGAETVRVGKAGGTGVTPSRIRKGTGTLKPTKGSATLPVASTRSPS